MVVLWSGVARADQPAWSYVPPAGWIAAPQQGGAVLLLPPGKAPTTSVLLMPVQVLEASFDDQFARERQRVESAFGVSKPQGTTVKQGSTAQGVFRIETSAYASAKGPIGVVVFGRAEGGLFGLMVLLADQPGLVAHGNEVATMFNATRLVGATGAAPVASNPAPSPAPGPRAATSTLAFRAPPRWTQAGNILSGPDLGGHHNVIEVLAGVPVEGSLTQVFAAQWGALMAARFVTPFQPLPLRVRHPSGAVILFDGDHAARERRTNASVGAFLYVISDGVTAVPVIAYIADWNDIKADLEAFFASIKLGEGRRAPRLYTQAEVAGTWRSSSSTIASMVDASGHYVSDASMASGETVEIAADGKCSVAFAAIGSGNRMRSRNAGKCPVEDDTLVEPSNVGPRRYRITGVGTAADGRARFLLLGITREDYPFWTSGSQGQGAGDLLVEPRK